MDRILTGIGILLFIVGLVMGIFSVIVLVQNITPPPFANPINWHIEAVLAIALLVVGGLMAIFGIKKS